MKNLYIAIDETGDFKENTFDKATRKNSSVVAIGTEVTKRSLYSVYKQIEKEHDIDCRHATAVRHDESFNTYSQKIISNAKWKLAVGGRLTDVYHIQQAYVTKLMKLLFQIHSTQSLKVYDKVHLIVASRKISFLVGCKEEDYQSIENYHKDLKMYIEKNIKKMGWASNTVVSIDNAQKNEYLIIADYVASYIRHNPNQYWYIEAQNIKDNIVYDKNMPMPNRADQIYQILLSKELGAEPERYIKGVDRKNLNDIMQHLSIMGNKSIIQRQFSLALDLAHFIHSNSNNENLKIDACHIATTALCRLGKNITSFISKEWSANLSNIKAKNRLVAESERLLFRCKTVQQESFHSFLFEDIYLEFCELYETYTENIIINEKDNIVAAIAGTIGQACGCLRAWDESLSDECMKWLEISKHSVDYKDTTFKKMSISFRMIELWDQNLFKDAKKLYKKESFTKLKHADCYEVTNLFRVSAGLQEKNDKLKERLLALYKENKNNFLGKAPYDRALKWVLYLYPNDEECLIIANEWCDALDKESNMLKACSLPLFQMIGRFEDATQNMLDLLEIVSFESYMNTDKFKPLQLAIESKKQNLNYKELKALPWYYS